MTTLCIVGAGMMGTAFATPFVANGCEVRLVGSPLDEDIVRDLQAGKDHPKLRAPAPAGIRSWSVRELPRALEGADLVALGVSSAGVRWAAEALGPLLRDAPRPVAMVSKGLEWNGGRGALDILPDVFTAALPEAARERVPVVGVAGPCIAGELLRRVPTAVVFTGRNEGACESFAAVARGSFYFVQVEPDVVGAEVCAALKNAFAMGVGFGAGVHEANGGAPGSVAHHNYEAAVFAQAIVEMHRMVELCGGDPATCVGLPGTGDLTVTCNGGRTGRFGKWLGTGLSLPEAIAKMEGATLECLEVLRELSHALRHFDSSGRTSSEDFPLLRHLVRVGAGEARVNVPFAEFTRSRKRRALG